MSPCSLERLISHAVRRLRNAEGKAARDASYQDEVEFWEAQVVRLMDKQDRTTDSA
jgi:hypothetical protein